MERWAQHLIRHRVRVTVIFGLLSLVSLVLLPFVQVNYDLSAYLPADMRTSVAMEKMEQSFGTTSMARVMAEGVDIPGALALKEQLQDVQGVQTVLWLDDVADVTQPLAYLGEAVTGDYYRDGRALFTVEFAQDGYAPATTQALRDIEVILGDTGAVDGPAYDTKVMQDTTQSQIGWIAAFVVPAFLLILVLTTTSWVEPLLYTLVIGLSVLINMGTNVLFPNISFLTQMTGAVLQFAISIDYSLFLMHRFTEERTKGRDVPTALTIAVKRSFSSLAASCLTTVAGFVALVFMRYRIGLDMGLVLVKGILISLISVLTLMPALIMLLLPLLDKTRHRRFLPTFDRLGRGVVRARFILLPLFAVLLVPLFLAQRATPFVYGETAITASSEGQSPVQRRMVETFGVYNPVVVLVPSGDIAAETALTADLEEKPYIRSIQGVAALADPNLPRSLLPDVLINQFETEGYARLILSLSMKDETPALFNAVDDLQRTVAAHYGDAYYLVGSSTSTTDIKEVVQQDQTVVNLFAILSVAAIILFTFRSLSLPAILVLAIEASIWINMGIPYFTGTPLAFIGYMIVSSVQLGATIDYAILLASRYRENRLQRIPKKEAAARAVADSALSILTSCAVLAAAGLTVYAVSSISGIADMGILIGRGALLSGLSVFTLLPALLVLCDWLIEKTTLKPRDKQKGRGPQ